MRTMSYGYFDDDAREYVITTPHTPYPWINYLGTEEFFGLISHTGGGYTFYRDALMRRLTRFRYNNVPTDSGGRCYYINDGGRHLVADLGSGTGRPGPLRGAARSFVHRDHRGAQRRSLRGPLPRPARHHRRDPPGPPHQHLQRRPLVPAVLARRILPLECSRRRHELPAESLPRRGRGRRQRHLSHHRVPGAAQPLLRLWREQRDRRLRHRPRVVRRAEKRLVGTAGGRRRAKPQLDRQRVGTDRFASGPRRSGGGRDTRPRVRPRLRRERCRRQVGIARNRQQGQGQGAPRPLRRLCGRRYRHAGTPRVLERPPRRRRGSPPETLASIAPSTPGIPTSAWSRSTCRAARRTSRAASDAGWASATQRRTCWDSCT